MQPAKQFVVILSILLAQVCLPRWVPDSSASNKIEEALTDGLSAVDRSKLPTGILYDRVLPISRIEAHDGGEASRSVTLAQWKQLYHEIWGASLQEPSWPHLTSILDAEKQRIREGVFPLVFMNFKYNRIRPTAFADGSLVIRDQRLVETGVGDPFLESRVFAVASLKDYTHRGEQVSFVLERDRYLTNDGVPPREIQVDFADGMGYRSVNFGRRYSVRYAETGRKTIKVNVAFTDDSTLQGSFAFRVVSLQTPTPHDTLMITSTIPFNGEFAGGEAYVYLSDLHTTLTNPAILIEGFDLDNTMNWDELYALINQENLVEILRGDGFDAVVLNFADATDYIQKNSLLIVELIEQVKTMISPMTDLAVVGASMGGLASRYALAYMETNGVDHRVRVFVSFDSPQSGANIPLGVQYWLDFFSGQSAEAAFLLSRLDTPAARQMLVYHHTGPPTTSGESDPLRADFLADLSSAGDYPSNLRKVAVANGSGYQNNQGFAAGDQIIDYEFSNLLVDIVGNVWAVPDGTTGAIFDGLFHIIFTTPEQLTVSVAGTQPFDSAPGGSRNSMAQMDSTEAPFGDIVALHDSHCFIPTISALDLDTQDLFYDVAGDQNLLAISPFDAVYFPIENQSHVDITPESALWLISEIEGTVSAVFAGRPYTPTVVRHRNFPNPFNPATTIRFELSRAEFVSLKIFTVEGREVTDLVSETLPAGSHKTTWSGRDHRGQPVASGSYFYRLQAGSQTMTRRMVLVK
ncbi:MAG: T9SS type A sorting domain-containing protein [Candidatus Krumholzibacteria bacterium]|nr:T9SS type A sorting domain-containing protein [Candidatus Krumholzibacteria bacterium]